MVTLRQPSLEIARRNTPIVSQIKAIKQQHPFWGYRQIWVYLNYHDGIVIIKKRVYRLMREHQPLVKEHRVLKPKEPRTHPNLKRHALIKSGE